MTSQGAVGKKGGRVSPPFAVPRLINRAAPIASAAIGLPMCEKRKGDAFECHEVKP